MAAISCLFCQIVAGKAPASIIYQDEQVTAFHDIHKATPTHVLIIPNRHISSLNEAEPADSELLGRLILTSRQIAITEGISQAGYRLVINTGFEGGQSIFHLHIHLLGGRRMSTLS
jgi:histidine triad (HIT) family protein